MHNNVIEEMEVSNAAKLLSDMSSDEMNAAISRVPEFIDIANRFCDLYVSYRKQFVMMINGAIFIPKTKSNGPIPLDNKKICQHLNKKFAIGIFAGAHSSKFICFDVDDGSRETVRQIIIQAVRFGIPEDLIYVSSSGGKGYHVEVFFDDLVYTKKLEIFYDWVCINGRLNTSKVEFRPTHKQSIKLPLSKHAKTGNVCWFVNTKTFEPYEAEDFILTINKMSATRFNELVESCGISNPVCGGLDDLLEVTPESVIPRVRSRELTDEEKRSIECLGTYPDITAPGQRHKLVFSIAVHNRMQGMTKAENIACLTKWWRQQDKTLTTTSDTEAMSDIEDVADWVYSDKFIPPKREKILAITEDLFRIVLAQKNKTSRKLLFLIGCYCSVYGRMNMSSDRISAYVECSPASAKRNLSILEQEGWITHSQGGSVHHDGKFIRNPNTYYISSKAKELCTAVDVKSKKTLPYIYEAKEIILNDEDGSMRTKTCIPELEPNGFVKFYYKTLCETLSKPCLRKYLTRAEYNALQSQYIDLNSKGEDL